MDDQIVYSPVLRHTLALTSSSKSTIQIRGNQNWSILIVTFCNLFLLSFMFLRLVLFSNSVKSLLFLNAPLEFELFILKNRTLGLCSLLNLLSTNYFQRLTLASWYPNLEQTPLNRCQQLPAPYKRLLQKRTETKSTNELLTDRLNNTRPKLTNLTNSRWIETHQWLMTNFTQVFQPIPSWLNWPITFNRPDL